MARTVHLSAARRVALRAATGAAARLQAGTAAVRPWQPAMVRGDVAITAASENEAEN